VNKLKQDIAFAWRNALKRPGTSLLIILTLALGIGANSAMFSMAYHVLFAPLPYADGERLVRIEQNEPEVGRANVPSSVQSFFDYRDQSSVFSDVLEYHSMQFTLLGHGDPRRVQTGVVSWNYFNVLGIRPLLGRTFTAGEDEIGSEPLIVLSNDFWVTQFNSDPGIVGATLEMNNAIHTVIGVLPPIPAFPDDNDIWVTASSCPFRASEMMINNRSMAMLSGVFGKLREGVTLEAASRDVNTVAQRLLTSYPDAYSEQRGYSASLRPLKDEMVGESAATFLLLLGIAVLVIFIACANVANLNLVRMAARNQELAIREALGANPSRIARQLLTESILFALAGGLLGLMVAYPGLSLLSEFAAGHTSLASEIAMDGTVFLFSLAVAVVTGIISGSASAFSRRDINKALKESSGKVTASAAGNKRRQLLLVVQFALSFVILTTAALIALSLYRLNSEDPGFDPDRVLVVSMDLNFSNYANNQQVRDFGTRLLEQARNLPGVDIAGIASDTPLQSGLLGARPFDIEGRVATDAGARATTEISVVTADYHRLMNIPLRRGRFLTAADDENAPAALLINRAFEQQHFPAGDAIGQRISMDGGQSWHEVVGVVGNVRSRGLDREPGPAVYVSFRQFPTSRIDLFLKSGADMQTLGGHVTDLIHGLDSQQAVAGINTLREIKSQWLATPRLIAILVGLFGLLATVMTLSGVIGVVSFNVNQRFREVGVRMAIGANPKHVRDLFLKQGLKMYLAGLAAGLALLGLGAPTLNDFLYRTSALNAGVYALSTLLLTAAVFGAMLLPANRASQLDPVMALHTD